MSNASGIVGKVNDRNTRVGKTYSFTLDGDDKWYGTFKTTPPAVGTYVEFEFETNGAGYHNVKEGTIKITDAPAGADAPPAARAAVAKLGNKEASINWQSARYSAVELAKAALGADCLSLGSGSKDAKLEALLIQVNRITLDMFDAAMEVAETGDAPADWRG